MTTEEMAERLVSKYAPRGGEAEFVAEMFDALLAMADDRKLAGIYGVEYRIPAAFRGGTI